MFYLQEKQVSEFFYDISDSIYISDSTILQYILSKIHAMKMRNVCFFTYILQFKNIDYLFWFTLCSGCLERPPSLQLEQFFYHSSIIISQTYVFEG